MNFEQFLNTMEIRIVKQLSDELIEGLERLLPQLSPTSAIPETSHWEELLHSDSSVLFIAEDNGRIEGTLTLVIYPTPLTRKAWIEDVVTDNEARGKGIGKLLVDAALTYARKLGIEKVDLTSSNDRTAAHGLYLKMGFDKRNTSVFRKYL